MLLFVLGIISKNWLSSYIYSIWSKLTCVSIKRFGLNPNSLDWLSKSLPSEDTVSIINLLSSCIKRESGWLFQQIPFIYTLIWFSTMLIHRVIATLYIVYYYIIYNIHKYFTFLNRPIKNLFKINSNFLNRKLD